MFMRLPAALKAWITVSTFTVWPAMSAAVDRHSMDVVGMPYDPMASEIIGIEEGDEKNDGFVTAEFQKGFYYGEKILRPAKVKIAKVKAPAPEAAVPDKTEEEK